MQRKLITMREFLSAAAENKLDTVIEYIEVTHPVDICVEIRSREHQNMNALMLAAHNGHEAVVKTILDYRARSLATKTLTSSDLDLNTVDDHGNSVLAHAAMNGSVPIFKMLVEHGADPRNKNILLKSPAQLATEFSHDDLAAAITETVNAMNTSQASVHALNMYRLYAQPTPQPTPVAVATRSIPGRASKKKQKR